LLKRQLSITVYCLLTKENNFPFSHAVNKRKFAVSVYDLQHKEKLLFSISSIFCGIPETLRHGDGDMETWRHRHGILTFYEKNQTEIGSPGDFP
jgi:hypothetical protein